MRPETFRFTFITTAAEALLGYPPARWINERDFWMEHMHHDDRERARILCAKAAGTKRATAIDFRMINSKGDAVWLRNQVSVLVENDRPAKLFGVMFDITDTKEKERAFDYLSELQRTLVDVSQRIIGSDRLRFDAVVTEALGRVGVHCSLDRCCVFRFSAELQVVSNTHEWCAPGISNEIDALQSIPRASIPCLIATMERHDILHVSCVSDVGPDWETEQSALPAPGYPVDGNRPAPGYRSTNHPSLQRRIAVDPGARGDRLSTRITCADSGPA